jgi:dUTP pyrophosphatase
MRVLYTKQLGSSAMCTAYPGDAGADLSCSVDTVIGPYAVGEISTGVRIALPTDAWGLIIARSSTRRLGLLIYHGVIDSGYRGEMIIVISNITPNSVMVTRGTRLAQLIVVPRPTVEWEEVDVLPPGDRGTRGWGSTG